MDIQEYLEKMKIIQENFLEYLEESSTNEENYNNIIELLKSSKIQNDKLELIEILNLIVSISNNYHRTSTFFAQIEKIILYFKNEINQSLTNFEIFNIFKSNKRLLLSLITNEIILIDQWFVDYIDEIKRNDFLHYFYPEVIKVDKNEFLRRCEFDADIEKFKEDRIIGENNNYICKLIRNDSIDDFISFVNRNLIPLSSSTIKPSIFETNQFLLSEEKVSLINYAAFFGSVQIFKYLFLNNVELNEKLWLYVIHGKNPELIHFLEENGIKSKSSDYEDCFIESVKCHHNDITNYIIDNLRPNSIVFDRLPCIEFYNFEFIENDFDKFESFYRLCKYNYPNLVNILLSTNSINTILHAAADNKNNDIVQIILKYKGVFSEAFLDCKSLKKLIIPSSITRISDGAFKGCTSLKTIEIPPTVKTIGKEAFKNCVELKFIEIPPFVERIEEMTFCGCRTLDKVIFPSSLTSIGESAFYDCKLIHDLLIPGTVNFIGKNSFYQCLSLFEIKLPNILSNINECTFYSCNLLKEVVIPSSVTIIESCSFYDCFSIEKVKIPSSVVSIGVDAFGFCSSLQSVEFESPSSIKEIKQNTFAQCSSLTKIEIPSSVTDIDNSAFEDCESLSEVTFPSSIEYIGNSAFNNCYSLFEVYVPMSSIVEINSFPKETIINFFE